MATETEKAEARKRAAENVIAFLELLGEKIPPWQAEGLVAIAERRLVDRIGRGQARPGALQADRRHRMIELTRAIQEKLEEGGASEALTAAAVLCTELLKVLCSACSGSGWAPTGHVNDMEPCPNGCPERKRPL